MKTQNERRFHRGFKDFIDFLEKEIYSSTCSSRNSRKIPMQSQILLVVSKNIMVISSLTLWALYPSPKISWTGVLMGIGHWRMCISASGLWTKKRALLLLGFWFKNAERNNIEILQKSISSSKCFDQRSTPYWISLLYCLLDIVMLNIIDTILDPRSTWKVEKWQDWYFFIYDLKLLKLRVTS